MPPQGMVTSPTQSRGERPATKLGGRAGGLLRDVGADRIGFENDDDRAPRVVERIRAEGRRQQLRGTRARAGA